MKQRILFLTFLAVASLSVSAQKRISASSPDGQTTVCVTLSDRIYYDVQSHGETVLQQCHVGMTLSDRVLGERPSLKGKQVKAVKETITPIHPLKFSQVDNNYTLLTLRFAGASISACGLHTPRFVRLFRPAAFIRRTICFILAGL